MAEKIGINALIVAGTRAEAVDKLFQLRIISVEERDEQIGWIRTELGLSKEMKREEHNLDKAYEQLPDSSKRRRE